jgi:ATP-binding cassette subfamily C protein
MIIPAIRKYLSTFLNVMAWKFALALGLMICLSLTEGISLILLVPLLQLVGLDVQRGSIGRLAEIVASFFSTLGIPPTLIVVLSTYVVVVIVHSLLRRWETSASLILEHEFAIRLRQRLYRDIANTNWLFFVRKRASDFTHALTMEMERIGAATYYLLNGLATAIVAAVYVLFAVKLSAAMTGLVFLCGGGLIFVLKKKTGVAHETGEGLSEAMKNLYHAVSEHLSGMKLAKSYGTEAHHVDLFGRLAEQVRHRYAHAVQTQAEVNFWFSAGSVILLGLILYISIQILSIPVAGVLLLLFLFVRIIPKFSAIQQNFQSFVNMLPSFSSVMELQRQCQEAAESKTEREERMEFHQGISVERVSFSYDGKAPVIHDVDLSIQAGKTTALVGPSGAGKTTFADLLMGLVAPNQGRILIDGAELVPERMKAWRKQIGYVPQDTFLFHDTLRTNLLWANPDANEAEMNRALELAAAGEFVSGLPERLDTMLGDRGVRVSGGERQRIALARALLRKPALLILDEATSSLDSENEKRIQNAIETLHGQMTILVISHRLSTIRNADRIHVVEEGRLVESGTWDRLASDPNGRFFALCQAQGISM